MLLPIFSGSEDLDTGMNTFEYPIILPTTAIFINVDILCQNS